MRRRVAHELELQLERIALVAPMTVPKTTSDKIQRALCHRQLAEGRPDLIADWRLGDPSRA
ncbi:MAG TPA: hypothetical protein VI248_05625 [Kineosporiaceae bacterium]